MITIYADLKLLSLLPSQKKKGQEISILNLPFENRHFNHVFKNGTDFSYSDKAVTTVCFELSDSR